MLVSLKIDDVVDASPVHLFCGVWGLLAAPIFCNKDIFDATFPDADSDDVGYGLLEDVSEVTYSWWQELII